MAAGKCYYAPTPGDPHEPRDDGDTPTPHNLYVLLSPSAEGAAKSRGRSKICICKHCKGLYEETELTPPE